MRHISRGCDCAFVVWVNAHTLLPELELVEFVMALVFTKADTAPLDTFNSAGL